MKFKPLFLTLMLFLIAGSLFSQSLGKDAQGIQKNGRLKVSENGHFLQYEDGTPFFWLGDTAWELFHRLKKEEIDFYLQNRRKKGFNVIQAVVLAEMDGLQRPNKYGDVPFDALDPEKPKESYFQLVDWTIKQALKKNMFIGLLPTWGDKVSKFWGVGPVVFNEKNAYNYGLFLGKRYKDYPNIVWITGGDRPAVVDTADWRPVWRAMIKGIKKGTNGKALVTYHPWGEHSSTDFWKDERLIDFNMIQSGHAKKDLPVWNWILKDFNRIPAKPVLDAEPSYEDHPVNWKLENGYFRADDIRKQLYRSVFAGAFGVTYGHHSVWQFYNSSEEKIAFADRYWTEALDRPGAAQAGYLKKLMLSRPSLNRVADQTLITAGQGDGAAYISAFRDGNLNYAMIYLPIGKEIGVNLTWMKTNQVDISWFNPRTGALKKTGLKKITENMLFRPPVTGAGNDWVLILDKAI